MARPKKTIKAAGGEEYQVSIKIGNEVSNFSTNDLVKTFLDFKPQSVKAKVLFSITRGDMHVDRMVLPRVARRYFTNEIFTNVFVNNLKTLLNG